MLAVGSTLGHYCILSILGAGGMGEVYRAHDPKLGRDVALKVLRGLTADPAASNRLIREARTTAMLSHPHICTVFEVGEQDGCVYIAMELIEGQSLYARIAGTAMPPETVIRYGVQIADALAHAHDRHVIHRDLTSANVVVGTDDWIKVLDFGLAKRVRSRAHRDSEITTETQSGIIVGTPQYLAPEVLLGEAPDVRSDLWSLGVVLYHMASGILPFGGATSFGLASSILNDIPAPLPGHVPPGLRAVIARCLSKAPRERYQSANEVRAALEALQGQDRETKAPSRMRLAAPSEEVPIRRPGTRIWMTVVTSIALLAAAAMGLKAWRWFQPPTVPKVTQLTTNSSENVILDAALSPDGTKLLFADAIGIHLREIATGKTRSVTVPQGKPFDATRISWYPGGDRFAASFGIFGELVGSGIWSISLVGWETVKLSDRGHSPFVSPDGSRIAYFTQDGPNSRNELWIMNADGSHSRRVAVSDSSGELLHAAWSPDGHLLALARVRSADLRQTFTVMDLRSGKEQAIARGMALQYAATVFWPEPKRILFTCKNPEGEPGEDLCEAMVRSRAPSKLEPSRRVTAFHFELASAGDGTVSRDGRHLCLMDGRTTVDIFVANLKPRTHEITNLRRLTLDDKDDSPSAWSPDGKSILFSSNRTGHMDVWEQAIDSNTPHQLFFDGNIKGQPKYVEGGAAILYWEGELGGKPSQRLMYAPRSGGPPRPVLESSGGKSLAVPQDADSNAVLAEWNSRRVVFTAVSPERGRLREIAQLAADSLLDLNLFWSWRLSDDGRHIAVLTAGARPTIRIMDLSTGRWRTVRLRLPSEYAGKEFFGGIAWEKGNRGFFLTDPQSLSGIVLYSDLQGATRTIFRTPTPIFDLRQSPDEHHIAVTCPSLNVNAWMLEGF
jgi:serine/threonine protein kinase